MSDNRDIARWKGGRVVVLGDVMVDRFVYGRVERISPEGPFPVLRHEGEAVVIGGAGNVARNIASLGGEAVLIGVTGADAAGDVAGAALAEEAGITGRLLRCETIPTTVKTRFMADGHQMLRLDVDPPRPWPSPMTLLLLDCVRENMLGAQAVVLSDYAKGVLGRELVAAVIALARASGVPVIVDPKRRDMSVYHGATLVTPNAAEARAATGLDCTTDEGAESAARRIQATAGIDAVVLTRGARGMTIVAPDERTAPVHLPSVVADVFDVSGAGDTVVATLALGLASGLGVAEAARLANVAAGIAVGRRGTAAVHAHELAHALQERSLATLDRKIATRDDAAIAVANWRAQGHRIGFTNGCFDLIHPGHVSLLRRARGACDRLVVAINSDTSVRRLKGPSRPVQNETARAIVMASIAAVDLVTIFDQDTPLDLITLLRPDLLFKGADYKPSEVVGADVVKKGRGQVVLIDLQEGHSTTALISRAVL